MARGYCRGRGPTEKVRSREDTDLKGESARRGEGAKTSDRFGAERGCSPNEAYEKVLENQALISFALVKVTTVPFQGAENVMESKTWKQSSRLARTSTNCYGS
jgi:hypothetical protein